VTRADALLAIALACAACGREGTTSPSSGAPTGSGSTTQSAQSAPPAATTAVLGAPARIVRLPVAIARASSEIEVTGAERLAEHAFDGDPTSAWCANKLGKDAWVEAELASPQALRRIVFRTRLGERLNGDGKTSAQHGVVNDAHVTFDAGGAGREIDVHSNATEPTSIQVPNGAPIKTIRIQVTSGTKGTKGDDVCISEVEVWGDAPKKGAPSGFAPKVRGKALDDALVNLPNMPRGEVGAQIDALGFGERGKKIALLTSLRAASRERVELDGDGGLESLVRLTLVQKFDAFVLSHEAIAVLDDEDHDEAVLGRRWIRGQLCLGKASGIMPEDLDLEGAKGGAPTPLPTLTVVSYHVAHTRAAYDVIVRSTSLDTCDEYSARGRDLLVVLTAERGALEMLGEHLAVWGRTIASEARLTPAIALECDANGPIPCALEALVSGKSASYSFSPDVFVFR
jgi:hypothetical protein